MKKLLFLLGFITIGFVCPKAFASRDDQKEPFTYVEIGTFAHSFEGNGITAGYGKRTFYRSNLAFDSSIFSGFGFNGEFVVAYKYVGLLYLSPVKSVVTPYVGLGGLIGMLSTKDIYNERLISVCSNALALIGAQIDIKGQRQFVSATYHLNSNAILLSIGRAF